MYAIPRVDNTEKIRSRKRAHHIGTDSDSDSDADFLPRKKNTCGAEFAPLSSLHAAANLL